MLSSNKPVFKSVCFICTVQGTHGLAPQCFMLQNSCLSACTTASNPYLIKAGELSCVHDGIASNVWPQSSPQPQQPFIPTETTVASYSCSPQQARPASSSCEGCLTLL